MATRRRARIERIRPLGEDVYAIDLRMIDEPIVFVGGQYVIAETGTHRDDKPVKRAYSIASSDREAATFTLVVRRHGDGIGSNAILARSVGDEVGFSGPWGRCFAAGGDKPVRRVVVTSIGITAALGIAQSLRLAGSSVAIDILVRDDEAPVLEADAVTEYLALDHVEVRKISIGTGAELGRYVDAHLDPSIDELFLVGSGRTNEALAVEAERVGVSPDRIRTEHFFDKPPQKPTATA